MTPTFRWVLLLALVGRAASVPRPLVVDACALLCNPGAETESEQERDPVLFPRYPKVNCKLQSENDEHQAWVIASHCMKLCNNELSISSEVNCFALRSSLQANLGCYCEALTPLSPNTMRLHESWRLNFLVKEIASDILTTILASPLDTLILCEIHQELFKDTQLKTGKMVEKCQINPENLTATESSRSKREVDEDAYAPWTEDKGNLYELMEEVTVEEDEMEPENSIADDMVKDEKLEEMLRDKELHNKLFNMGEAEVRSVWNKDNPVFNDFIREWKHVCKKMCKEDRGNEYCQCKNPQLED